MRALTPALLILLLASASVPAFAQDMGGMGGDEMGGMGGMGGGGMGGGGRGGGGGRHHGGEGGGMGGERGFQPPKPIKRDRFDKLVTEMFRTADTNHDGIVTLAELHALVESRRLTIIQARFAQIDTNRDGAISPAEFMVWQMQLGAAAAQDAAAAAERNGPVPEAIMPDPGNNREDRMIASLIDPLTGTVIGQANTDYDAGVSLPELLAYEGKRFEAADTDHDGYLSMQELRAARGHDGRRGGPGRPGGSGGAGGPPPPETP